MLLAANLGGLMGGLAIVNLSMSLERLTGAQTPIGEIGACGYLSK